MTTKGSRNLFSYKTKQTEHFSKIGLWGPGVQSDLYLHLRDFRTLTRGPQGCLRIKEADVPCTRYCTLFPIQAQAKKNSSLNI